MKLKYNRLEAGDRIKQKRILLGMKQDEVSLKIGLSSKYYADIERGSCGMSIESLISIGKILDMSLDYIIYGKASGEEETIRNTDEIQAILSILNNTSEQKQKYILRLLQLQLAVWDSENKETEA